MKRRGRSGLYRARDGTERLWYSPADIENMMEDALRRADLLPSIENPPVEIEQFIQSLKVRMDQYAELDQSVLGLTEFYTNRPAKIMINRDLTGAIDDDNTPPGIRGRWRATMAHEASHVVLHSVLFQVDDSQHTLFQTEPQPESHQLMRCLKKDVLFRQGGAGDWREVQANMGMAALLMPQGVFRQLAESAVRDLSLPIESLTTVSAATSSLSERMATQFDVSRQAAGIRLQTLGFVRPPQQPWLLHSDEPA